MRKLPIDLGDVELMEAATALLTARYHSGRHHVAAALRTGSGEIVTGLHVGSRRINICAEQIALGAALASGHTTFSAGIAVIMMDAGDLPRITSPCGVCREVLSFYAPDMSVIVDAGGEALKTYISDLLPAPWLLPSESNAIPRLIVDRVTTTADPQAP
jgi:cytidine deaminase